MHRTPKLVDINHFIDRAEAKRLVDNYERNKDELINPKYSSEQKEYGILPESEAFNEKSILAILAQKDCIGIRIHYGLKDEDENGNKVPLICTVLVGVDSNGDNMWGEAIMPEPGKPRGVGLPTADPGGVIVEDSQRCPPFPKSQPQP